MYYSSSVSKRLILVLLLAIQLILISSVLSLNMTNAYLSHKCLVSQGNYKPGSIDELAVKDAILAIASNVQGYSSYRSWEPETNETTFYAILQCRGDSFGPKCRDCFYTAAAGIGKRCPRYKGAIIWYDQCMFAYSSSKKDGRGIVDKENNYCMPNTKRVDKDKIAFKVSVDNLIRDLAAIAATPTNKSEPKKRMNDPDALYAAGERLFKKTKLYGMVQCTQDISEKACQDCVLSNMKHFQDCLRDKQGGRVLGRSCNLRFELYPFATRMGPRYLKG